MQRGVAQYLFYVRRILVKSFAEYGLSFPSYCFHLKEASRHHSLIVSSQFLRLGSTVVLL